MTEILVFFLGVGLYLYVLLGGADFGAGVVELLAGKKGVRTISRAIAPIWETNHVWIILVVVILFNGFPKVYTTISTYLHIPLLLALIGIIIRGSSFTFRYYDIPEKKVNVYYNNFFRISSLVTPFFFGMILGAIISGKIPPTANGTFYDVYMNPWLTWFSVSTGIFVTLLFGWLASVYLIGEVENKEQAGMNLSMMANSLFLFLIFSGILVFAIAEFSGIHLLRQFLNSYISIACMIVATILVPIMWRNIKKQHVTKTRIYAGILTFCILLGWFGMQLPTMVFVKGGNHLTIWNTLAPYATIKYLVYALVIGILIIFPSIAYLYKVFKFKQT